LAPRLRFLLWPREETAALLLGEKAVGHAPHPLPHRKQEPAPAQQGQPERAVKLPPLAMIDLADDRIVPDVFLDGVFDVDAHAALSTTRSRALRARGLRWTSASSGPIGFRVSNATFPSAASGRNVRLPARSASE